MTLKKRLMLAASTGILMALAFPPMPLFFLIFFAFIPLFTALEKERNYKYLLVYIAFFAYHAGTQWWISSWQEHTDPYLFVSGIVVAILHPLFFLAPFAVYFILRKYIGQNIALWFFPVVWTIFEWLHSLGDLGYTWLSIAHTQHTNIYWYQILDIAGTYGCSLLIAFANILIYKIIIKARTMPANQSGRMYLRGLFRPLENKIYAFLIYFILMLPMVYGYMVIKDYDYDRDLAAHKYINIGLIQPNIDPWHKWEKDNLQQINTLIKLQDSLVKAMGRINLFIWPETAIPMLNMRINTELRFGSIQDNVNRHGTSLLAGMAQYKFFKPNEPLPVTVRYASNDSSHPFCAYNAAVMLNPAPYSTYPPQTYHKGKLTPFAEGMPFVEQLTFAKDWVKWGVGISSWTKGNRQYNLEVKNSDAHCAIAPVICIESIFPDFVRNFVDNGAQVMAVITNDAWYDHTFGPEQHYVIAATRAIENRRYLARCANSGVTGFISPIGTSLFRADQYKPTAIAASIPLIDGNKTFYTIHGDYLPKALCLIMLAGVPAVYVRRKNTSHKK